MSNRLLYFGCRNYNNEQGTSCMYVNPGLTVKEATFLYNYFSITTFRHVFSINNAVATEYYHRVASIGEPDAIFSATAAKQYMNVLNDLFDTVDPAEVYKVRNYKVKDVVANSYGVDISLLLLLFFPAAYCEGCDTQDHLIYYWLPYNCFRKQELVDFLKNSGDPIGNQLQPEVSTCPGCQPRQYTQITGHWAYSRFSEHAVSNCKCAACGGR
jgi:hypothetical protein